MRRNIRVFDFPGVPTYKARALHRPDTTRDEAGRHFSSLRVITIHLNTGNWTWRLDLMMLNLDGFNKRPTQSVQILHNSCEIRLNATQFL